MSNLIQDLIRDGDLAAWYDFRSGTVDDLSGNGRDCTIVGTPHFNREGLSFSDLSSYLSLPLSAFPSSNSLTIVWFCTFTDANNNDWTRVLGSDDSGGGGYEMRTATDDVIMGYVSGTNQNSNGGGSVPTGVPFMGALTCDESGGSTTQKYYVDGVEKDSTVVASTVNTPDTSLWIGHFAADGLIGSVVSVLFIDRVLNITEIGNIMGETRAQRWPTKPTSKTTAVDGTNPEAIQFRTDWGTPVTVPASVGAGAQLGPFMVDSGAFKLTTDTIEGKKTKVIECVTDGVVYVDMLQWMTPSEEAYGTWEIYVYKANTADDMDLVFIADTIGGLEAAGQDGYGFRYANTDDGIYLYESAAGALNWMGHFIGLTPAGAWYLLHLDRHVSGMFDMWVIDNSGIGSASDTTTTTGRYMAIEMDAGDKVALADVGGGHAILKRLGAV